MSVAVRHSSTDSIFSTVKVLYVKMFLGRIIPASFTGLFCFDERYDTVRLYALAAITTQTFFTQRWTAKLETVLVRYCFEELRKPTLLAYSCSCSCCVYGSVCTDSTLLPIGVSGNKTHCFSYGFFWRTQVTDSPHTFTFEWLVFLSPRIQTVIQIFLQ